MYIIKRKNIVKIISFFLGLILIIVGFILQKKNTEVTKLKKEENICISILTNICALLENTNNSFKKMSDLSNFSTQSKEIYANSMTIGSLFTLCEENTEKAQAWFSKLCDYAKTDMNDKSKNEYYSKKIEEIEITLMNICRSGKIDTAFSKIDDLFSKEQDIDYENILFNTEKQYSFLENRITAERKDISNYAKEILGVTFLSSQFKGNYIYPKAVSYSSSNAYANIFTSGKILLIMSEEDGSSSLHNLDENLSTLAEKALRKYADYSEYFSLAHTKTAGSLTYFIFCPIFENNGYTVINYDESINVALSSNSGRLKAFNASRFLKNHPILPSNEIPEACNNEHLSDNLTLINKKHVIYNGKYYIESHVECSEGSMYYHLCNNNESIFLTEDEFIKQIEQK